MDDTNKPTTQTPQETPSTGVPAGATPPPPASAEPSMESLLGGGSTWTPAQPAGGDTPLPVGPDDKKKNKKRGMLVAIILLLLLTLPIIGYFGIQQSQDIRDRAAYPTGANDCSGSCSASASSPNNWSGSCSGYNTATSYVVALHHCPDATLGTLPVGGSGPYCNGPAVSWNRFDGKPGSISASGGDSCGCYQFDIGVDGPGCPNTTVWGQVRCFDTPCSGGGGNTPTPTQPSGNTPTHTPTRTPTPTPNPQCGSNCTSSTQCPNNHTCANTGKCVLTACTTGNNTCSTDKCTITNSPTPTTTTTATPTPTTITGQCDDIKIYKGNAVVNPNTLRPGDQIVIAVVGTNATKARVRVNGGAFTETSTKNNANEYTLNFTIPASGTTTFTVEAELFIADSWR